MIGLFPEPFRHAMECKCIARRSNAGGAELKIGEKDIIIHDGAEDRLIGDGETFNHLPVEKVRPVRPRHRQSVAVFEINHQIKGDGLMLKPNLFHGDVSKMQRLVGI